MADGEPKAGPDQGTLEPPAPNPLLDPENAPLPKSGWLRKWPWVTFLVPFVIFLLVGSVEPAALDDKEKAEIERLNEQLESDNIAERGMAKEQLEKLEKEHSHAIPYKHYPLVYTIKIGLTTLAMLVVIPGYMAFRTRVHGIAWGVGAVGAVVWILLAKLQVATYPMLPEMLSSLLEMGGRSGFNPLVELKDNPTWAYGFLAIRFFGLVVVVAVIEEFFLRGFLMRYVMDIDWPLIPFGVVNRLGLATVILFPIVYHPERLAAAAWFSMVTWLMLRTKSIWDCVIAHAVTNLLMGLWVVYSGDWWMM
jgi:CAAX prenyl protease-like protein